MKWLQLQLRDLFWLVLIAAVGVSWGWERYRLLREIPKEDDFVRIWRREVTDEPSEDALARRREANRLQTLTEQELVALLDDPPDVQIYAGLFGGSDLIWLEMARRGMGEELRRLLDKQRAFREAGDASLKTAVCRAEGKPDPLAIVVELPGRNREGALAREPFVVARLKNVDADCEPVSLFQGGDYRGGRPERWRVELTNKQGVKCSDSNFQAFIGGGLCMTKTYDSGEMGDPFWLDARSYTAPPKSGEYTLQVSHSVPEIANEPDLTGIIVWKSDPIKIIVENNDEKIRQRAMIPPLVILILSTAACFTVTARWISKRNRVNNATRQSMIRWRDGLALILVLTISLGWLINAWQLRKKLQELQPHSNANWTMRLAGQ